MFTSPSRPFPGHCRCSLQEADAVLFDAPHGTPYRGIDSGLSAGAGDALRRALADDAAWTGHWDFDLDGPLLGEGDFRFVDAGTLDTAPGDGLGNRSRIAEATAAIVAAGAVPVMIGGDDSTPIPFLDALAPIGPLTVFQIDAHIDWREERRGEPMGFSSTMRRASEMDHVERIVQAGIRGLGSARAAEVEYARDWGAHIVTADALRRAGPQAALAQVPEGVAVAITLDVDALDAGIMPACAAPTPGGLSYSDVIGLITGIAARARIAAFDLIEFAPSRDPDGLAAYSAGRIVWQVIGRLARQR